MGHATIDSGVYQGEPSVRSYAAQVHEHGEDPPYIVVEPFGETTVSGITLYLDIDEAENLARKLLDVAMAAKSGIYSPDGR
jgi:hypothetical protein